MTAINRSLTKIQMKPPLGMFAPCSPKSQTIFVPKLKVVRKVTKWTCALSLMFNASLMELVLRFLYSFGVSMRTIKMSHLNAARVAHIHARPRTFARCRSSPRLVYPLRFIFYDGVCVYEKYYRYHYIQHCCFRFRWIYFSISRRRSPRQHVTPEPTSNEPKWKCP